LFLLGLLALPAAAYAGPQVTVSPQQGPSGALFVLTGVGFAPSTTYYLRIAAQDGTRAIEFDDPTTESADDGVIIADLRFSDTVPAGSYVASIATEATGGVVVASATFAITGIGGATSGPHLAITPAQAGGGELFLLTGTGFAPGGAYALRIRTQNRQAVPLDNAELRADADGVILSGFTLAAARDPGAYVAEVLTTGGTPTIAASAEFTLPAPSAIPSPPATGTGGQLPGLPNTGDGGMSAPDGGFAALLIGSSLVAGAACAAVMALVRRRA
jgi:hypothetical protein